MSIAANVFIETIAAVPWLELIKSLAPVVTAWIAYQALRNWKRQDKAKREAEFLDHLIDAAHQHIVEIRGPVELLRMAKIGMASHVENWGNDEENERVISGAIAYIRKDGKDDGKRLRAALGAIEPTVVRLRSLAVKGQVFKFKNYQECQNAVMNLTWHFDRLYGFLSIIEIPTWNWQNEEVFDLLKKVIVIEPDEIIKEMSAKNSTIIKFVRDAYTRIYG